MSKARKIENAISEAWAKELDAQVFKRFRLKCETTYALFSGVYVTNFNPKYKDKVRLRKAHAFIAGFMAGLELAQSKIREQR